MDHSIQQLTIRARNGENAAFECLHERLFLPLSRFLTRLSGIDGSIADELANETLAEAFNLLRSGQYDPTKARFTTFVYAIGRIRALRKRRQRASSRETAMSDLPDSNAGEVFLAQAPTSAAVFEAAEIEAMLDCLSTERAPFGLSPEERFVIVGLTEGSTLKVLARNLGRSIATVHDRKTRAIHKLRQCLSAKGFAADSSSEEPQSQISTTEIEVSR